MIFNPTDHMTTTEAEIILSFSKDGVQKALPGKGMVSREFSAVSMCYFHNSKTKSKQDFFHVT